MAPNQLGLFRPSSPSSSHKSGEREDGSKCSSVSGSSDGPESIEMSASFSGNTPSPGTAIQQIAHPERSENPYHVFNSAMKTFLVVNVSAVATLSGLSSNVYFPAQEDISAVGAKYPLTFLQDMR